MNQTGLIKRILEAIGIEGANPKSTPAETEALPADKTGNTTEPDSIKQMLLECYNICKGILDQIFLLQ